MSEILTHFTQLPGTALSEASGGLLDISHPSTQRRRPRLGGSLERGLRAFRPDRSACSQASSWRRAPLPWT